MLRIMKGLHLTLLTLLFISCLPQEKTTQCKSNEAYDSTQRRCVATLGANGQTVSISNVTPTTSYTISFSDASITHSVTISDPYSFGYQVRWYITKPSGATNLIGTGLALTFNHTAESTGSYILEAQVLDSNGTQIFDTRSWSINVIQETVPTVYTETASPFTTTTAGPDTTIDATIQNPDGISGVQYQWYVNGTAVAGESGSTSAVSLDVDFDFDPTSAASYFAGTGVYTIQLVLTDSSNNTYSSELWTATNNIPGFANVGVGTNSTTFAAATQTPADGSIVTVIDEHPISGTGFVYDAGYDPGGFRVTTTTTNDTPVDFCVTGTDDNDGTLDGVDGDGVWVDFLIDGNPIGGAIDVQMTNESTDYCLFEDVGIDFSYNLPSNIVTESHTLSMVVYDKFTGQTSFPKYKGYNEIQRFTYTLRVRQANTPPTVTILDTTDDPLENIECANKTSTQYSNCEITWGDNKDEFDIANAAQPIKLRIKVEDDDYDPLDAAESAEFELEVYVQNELADTSMPNKYSFSDCAVDPATTAIDGDGYFCDIIINPFDANGVVDYSTANFTIGALVRDKGSPYDSVTTRASNEVQWLVNSVLDYNDQIDIEPFDSDTDDSYVALASVPGTALTLEEDGGVGVTEEGVLIQFRVKVTDNQRDNHVISIDQLYCNDPDPDTCDPNNAAYVAANLVTKIPDVATTTVTWGDEDSADNTVAINHQIRYDALEGDDAIDTNGRGIAYYRVRVDDTTGAPSTNLPGVNCRGADVNDFDGDANTTEIVGDSFPACYTSDSEIVRINIDNKNPDARFDNPALADPALPSTINVFAGMPVTIDPGPVSDDSTADGENIEYAWVVSSDGGTSWKKIETNNDRILVWTPSPEIAFESQFSNQAIQLKLCLGDDGFQDGTDDEKTALDTDSTDADEEDCAANGTSRDSSTATGLGGLGDVWNVNVISNMALGMAYDNNSTANTGDGEIAVWIDPTSVDPIVKYMAYVTINKQIVVEKHVVTAAGVKGGSLDDDADGGADGATTGHLENIIFDASTDAAFASNEVTNLSMVGDPTNGSLYIAYMAPLNNGTVDSVHVRRINIGGSKTGFVHDGTFGWDPGYNDLTDNIVVASLGITAETINGDGNAEIVFTQSASAVAMSVTFDGLHGGSDSMVAGTDFCVPTSSCTTVNDTAQAFADAVVASTKTELQGLSAVANGATVEFIGISEDDHFQDDIGAADIGQIMINETTGKWQIPIIDIDQAGTDKFKISMYEGDLGVRIEDSNMTKTLLSGTGNVQATELANDRAADDTVIIAAKALSTGLIHVLEVSTANAVVENNTDVFTDSNITELKVAVSKEDSEFAPNAYITGKNDSGNLAFARIDSTLSTGPVSVDFDLDAGDIVAYEELDAGFAALSPINSYDITAGPEQYQMLLATHYNDHTYMIKIEGTTPAASCSYDSADLQNTDKCSAIQPIAFTNALNETDRVRSFDLGIAMSDVLEDAVIGDEGKTADENEGDFIGFANHIDLTGAGNASIDGAPVMGILNVRGTDATTTESTTFISPMTAVTNFHNSSYIIPYVAP